MTTESAGAGPFARYPDGGRVPLGRPRRTDNCRYGYGLELQRVAGVSTCAYCGISLTADYYRWLLMQVDHVVPRSVGTRFGIPPDYIEDFFNLVLACAGCNAFKNRYTVHVSLPDDGWTPAAFADLRDLIFAERFHQIRARRDSEVRFFTSRPWTVGR